MAHFSEIPKFQHLQQGACEHASALPFGVRGAPQRRPPRRAPDSPPCSRRAAAGSGRREAERGTACPVHARTGTEFARFRLFSWRSVPCSLRPAHQSTRRLGEHRHVVLAEATPERATEPVASPAGPDGGHTGAWPGHSPPGCLADSGETTHEVFVTVFPSRLCSNARLIQAKATPEVCRGLFRFRRRIPLC